MGNQSSSSAAPFQTSYNFPSFKMPLRTIKEEENEDRDDEVVEVRPPPVKIEKPTVIIDVTQDATNNRDHRAEERWHTSIDSLAREWRDSCMEQSKEHDKAGYGARLKHLVFGLPAPVTAIVTTAVAALWDSPDIKYAVVPLSSLAAIFSAVHVFLDMAGQAQLHWNYSAQYGGVASKIGAQLARDVDFRRPADEFMAETRVEIGNLNASAPQLPGTGCCGCSPREGTVPGLETEEELENRRQLHKQLAERRALNEAEHRRAFEASNSK